MEQVAQMLAYGSALNLGKVEALMKDIAPDVMTHQPTGVMNHPAWTIAHLVHYHPAILCMLRGEVIADPGLHPDAPRFDAGSIPVDDVAACPTRDALLGQYRRGHQDAERLLQSVDGEVLQGKPGLPRWAKAFGTVEKALVYLMLYHESLHIGEIMVWRRAMGLPPLE